MMNPNCEHIETLLPAFVEETLDAGDAAAVRAHVESCDACRASLAAFALLEQSLVARRAEVPPLERFLPDFATARVRAANVPRPSLVMRAFRTMMSLPGIAAILVVWSGLFVFEFRDSIGHAIALATPDRLVMFQERLANLLVLMTDGNVWALVAISILVSILFALSTGAMTLRYIRGH
jgi:predicted anti-sigma-YlaC factor YlaD